MGIEEAIRVIRFSGKKEDWPYWKGQFLARAGRKGFKNVITGKEPLMSDNKISKLTDSAKKTTLEKNAELNVLAYEELILSMDISKPTGKIAYKLIDNCKTDDFPEGNSALAWKKLMSKYAPTTAPSLCKLEREFHNSKLDINKDPEEWIIELETINDKLACIAEEHKYTEKKIITHILNNVPEEYELEIKELETRLMDITKPLNLEQVKDTLGLRYERLKGKTNNNENDHEGHAHFGGGFKGRCRKCGKSDTRVWIASIGRKTRKRRRNGKKK